MTANPPQARPKLPVQQLAILAIARFAEPMAYTSVFPYLPEMIGRFGVEQNEIGKWAGATSSVFSLAQSITAIPWGRAADAYGRKPALILGLISTMITFVIWGMSTSLPMAIIVRAIMGGGNGNVGIIRTVVAEMVPEKELQPRAFSIMPLVWSLGSVVGPAFGGALAEPAKQYPDIFGEWEFFKKFPFALPNLVAMLFFLVSLTCATLFLKETLPSKRGDKDWGLKVGERVSRALSRRPHHSQRRSSFMDGEATAPLVPKKGVNNGRPNQKLPPPTMREVLTKQTALNLFNYTILAFHSVAYDQVLSVFLHHPVVEHTPGNTRFPFYFDGGFGLGTGKIGTIFMLYGIICGLIQFIVYPPLVQHFGVLKCFRICCLIFPISFILTPFSVLMPTIGGRYTMLAIAMLLKAMCTIIAFPSTVILLTNSCTSLRVLGTLNGVATATSGLGRAVGPASTGAIFTWGADNGYIMSSFAFLTLISLIGVLPPFFIVDGDGPKATPDGSDSEDTDDQEDLLTGSAIEEDEDGADTRERAPLLKTNQSLDANYSTTSGGQARN